MSDDEAAEYSLWVQLANDPSQTDEVRRHYRVQMEAYVRRRMREAFQLAAEQTIPAPVSMRR